MATDIIKNIQTQKDLEMFLSLNPFVEDIIRGETGEHTLNRRELVSKIYDPDLFNNNKYSEIDPSSGRPCIKKVLLKIKNGNFSRSIKNR
jgi:hypothetical protein